MKLFLFLLVAVVTGEEVTTEITTESDVTTEIIEIGDEQPHCIMYDHCGPSPSDPSHTLNCLYTGPPKILDPDSLATLSLYCPELVARSNSTCCSSDQVVDLVTNLALPQTIIGRCPGCWDNFRKAFCEVACSGEQSLFLKATGVVKDGNVTMVSELTAWIDSNYTTATYESCKNVIMSSTNGPAMDFLCGPWGAYRCTPERWYTYMGSTSNGFSPFDILYNFTTPTTPPPHKIHPLTAPTTSCGQPVHGKSCACVDCEEACPAGSNWQEEEEPFLLWGVEGGVVVMATVWLLGIVLLSVLLLVGDPSPRPTPSHTHSKFTQFSTNFENTLRTIFTFIGTWTSAHPIKTIIPTLILVAMATYGIRFLEITTDPVELWASPESRSRIEKDYFDEHFEPFYRTGQVIITTKSSSLIWHNTSEGLESFGPAFQMDFLKDVLNLVESIKALKTENGVGLGDVCFKPLSPANENCTIFSPLGYWQDSLSTLTTTTPPDNYLDHFKFCSVNPTSPKDSTQLHQSCLAPYGGPIDPALVLGGFTANGQKPGPHPQYKNSNTAIITLVINNHYNKSENHPALLWELEFIRFMKDYVTKRGNYSIAFNSERSIEDELERESHGEIGTVLFSYGIMFLYIALSLGEVTQIRRFFVDSKISLGIVGVGVVLGSVGCSVGVFGWVGVPATLIIIEVIPFLVLAVGVDNIFILTQTYQRSTRLEKESHAQHIGRVVGEVGPSILLSSISESLCFFLGGLSGMPAVKAFALYAGLAVFLNFLLQMSVFVSLMGLDRVRQKGGRLDVLCCFHGPPETSEAPTTPPGTTNPTPHQDSFLYKAIKNVYSPFLFKYPVRVAVIFGFFTFFCINVVLVSRIDVGLEQELSMPEDSYVLNYFRTLTTHLSIGPPVYFILPSPYNYSSHTSQNLIRAGTNPHSLVSQIFSASKSPNATFIAKPTASWLDDYIDWAGNDNCCKINKTDATFCPNTASLKECKSCGIELEDGLIGERDFGKYLSFFLRDNPNEDCPKGGHAAYGQGVRYKVDKDGIATAGASYFMTYHTVLKSSKDYTSALSSARAIAANITSTIKTSVFPYSIFYVFYEQYLTMWRDTLTSLSISLSAIFLVTFILTGFSISAALIVLLTITMIITNVMGMMTLWGISLNAISLVNLVMAVGIGVEFCTHIVHAFLVSVEVEGVERGRDALVNMGSSVLSGITFTKFGGILVLGFAKSQIFRIFYFRIYLLIVLSGAAHGLIFLPVLLSFLGPRGVVVVGRRASRGVLSEESRRRSSVVGRM